MIPAVTTNIIRHFFLVFEPELGVIISTDEYDGCVRIYIKLRINNTTHSYSIQRANVTIEQSFLPAG